MTVLSETKTERVKPLVSADANLKKTGQAVNSEEFANILEFKNKNLVVQKDKLSSFMIANSKALGALGQAEVKKQSYDYAKKNESQNNSYLSAEKPYEKKDDDQVIQNKNDINYNDPNLYINAYSVQKAENLSREKPSEPVKTQKAEKTEVAEKPQASEKTEVSEKLEASEPLELKKKIESEKNNILFAQEKSVISSEIASADKLTEALTPIKSKKAVDSIKEEVVSEEVKEVQNPQDVSKLDNNKKVLANVQNMTKEVSENLEKVKNKAEIKFEKDATIKVSDNGSGSASEESKNNTVQNGDNKPTINNPINQKVQKNIEQTEDVKEMMARMSIQEHSKDASTSGKNGNNLNNSGQKHLESRAVGITDVQNNAKSEFSAKLKTEKLETPQRSELAKNVLTQVNEKMKAELKQGNNKEITISLKPDNLGKVDIKLTSVNGVLTAQINTENQHVKDIINKGLEALKQNLADQGISVGKMVVQSTESPSSNNNNGQQFSENQQFFDKSNLNSQNQSFRNSQNQSDNTFNERYEKGLSVEEIDTNDSSQSKKIINNKGLVDYTI